jgi:hypothetical protein
MEEERLWIDSNAIWDISNQIGFSEFHLLPINPQIWQSTHMFDLLLVR